MTNAVTKGVSSQTKTAIVTGAGRGIGEAIARAAASAGYVVGVLDRDIRGAATVAESIGGVGLVAAINQEE